MRLSRGWSAKRKRERHFVCSLLHIFWKTTTSSFLFRSHPDLQHPQIPLAQTSLWEVASPAGRSSLTAISERPPSRMPPPNSASVSLDSFAISTPPQTKHRASTELLPCRPLHPHPTSHRRICRFPTTLTLSLRTIAPMTRMWISSARGPLCTIHSCPH